MNTPLVSIIIPVYNVEKYLRQCLDSVVNQTLKDIEIICVDDGSPDNCGTILDEYAAKDSRVAVIHQENGGLGHARNVGVRAAHAPYLYFVDSDDWLDLTCVEKLYQRISEADAEICFYGYIIYNNKNKRMRNESGKIDFNSNLINKICCGQDLKENLGCMQNAFCKIYNKDFFIRKNLFFEENVYFEDVVTHIKLLTFAQKVCFLPEYLYFYRTNRQNSIMNCSYDYKKVQDVFTFLKRGEDILRENHIFDKMNFFYFHSYFQHIKYHWDLQLSQQNISASQKYFKKELVLYFNERNIENICKEDKRLYREFCYLKKYILAKNIFIGSKILGIFKNKEKFLVYLFGLRIFNWQSNLYRNKFLLFGLELYREKYKDKMDIFYLCRIPVYSKLRNKSALYR